MLEIPYLSQPDSKSCALACYTMTAQHFFPDTTLEEVSKVAGWEPGYVVWAFKFWLWLMGKGTRVTEIDSLDYEAWVKEGVEGLKRSLPEKEFEYYRKYSKDLDSYRDDIQKVFAHQDFTHAPESPRCKPGDEWQKPGAFGAGFRSAGRRKERDAAVRPRSFTFLKRNPNFDDLQSALSKCNICELTLDSRTLRKKEGFSGHRVVMLGVEDGRAFFHDPWVGPNEEAPLELFQKAWLEAIGEPELCIYPSSASESERRKPRL